MRVGFVLIGHDSRIRACASQMVQSVRTAMPDVPVVQYSDAAAVRVNGVTEVQRRIEGGSAMAWDVIRAYRSASSDGGEWLFLDTDVLVHHDVSAVFDFGFDVAVADRAGTLKETEVGSKFMARMPYNKGVVFSRSEPFWAAADALMASYSTVRQAWMGDQQAVNDVIAGGAFDVKVLGNVYNYPPQSRHDDLGGKAITHWKGARKQWLLERAS